MATSTLLLLFYLLRILSTRSEYHSVISPHLVTDLSLLAIWRYT